MKISKDHTSIVARELQVATDISSEPHALELAVLTLAASNLVPRQDKDCPLENAAEDTLQLYLDIRELFLDKLKRG